VRNIVTAGWLYEVTRGCTEKRGTAYRVPRVGEFHGPRTALGRIRWTAYRVQVSHVCLFRNESDEVQNHMIMLDVLGARVVVPGLA